MRDGACGYLIRNSWGMGCSIYTDEIKRHCNASEGTFWISEEQLTSVTKEVSWIE
jgi:hypothetical protein